MKKVDKSLPDVLRVTEFILKMNKQHEKFSLQAAAESEDLNGIGRYQISHIMRDICLDPEDKGSLARYTTIDDTHLDNMPMHWQLNAASYFNYLSYLSVQSSKKANKTAVNALCIAALSTLLTFISLIASVVIG